MKTLQDISDSAHYSSFTHHPSPIRVAIFVWAAMTLAVTLRVAIAKNGSGSVFPVYRTAATAWVDGLDLYTLDFSKPCFRYHPLVAAGFAPFGFVPERIASILWRWLGVAFFLSGMVLWQRRFHGEFSVVQRGWFFLLAAPLALQSFNNGQVNLHLIGLILLALVAADRNRWNLAALLLAIATLFKLYPIAIGMLLAIVYRRPFAWRYGVMLVAAFLLPFLFQHPDYVAGQYRLWFEYLLVDARHMGAIEQAPRDLFLLIRYWADAPPEWLYRGVQLGSAGLIALCCLRDSKNPSPDPSPKRGGESESSPLPASGRGRGRGSSEVLTAILHLGCIWMTLLGPSTESCTYTLLAPTAAAVLILAGAQQSRFVVGLAIAAYTLLVIPTVAAAFPGGTHVQHWGPQPAGALLLLFAVALSLRADTSLEPIQRGAL